MGAAYALALPMAFDRERASRSAGLRTFPLVAVASCGYLLVGAETFGSDSDDALARLLYGLMTGIGFIGGGAILKEHGRVSGTATAAAIWCTGAIGAAVAFSRWEVALTVSVVASITLIGLRPVKDRIGKDDEQD